MTGDVALTELGMSEEDYTFLTYEVTSTIHPTICFQVHLNKLLSANWVQF